MIQNSMNKQAAKLYTRASQRGQVNTGLVVVKQQESAAGMQQKVKFSTVLKSLLVGQPHQGKERTKGRNRCVGTK